MQHIGIQWLVMFYMVHRKPLDRLALHATSLEFLHPENDEPVRFEARNPLLHNNSTTP